MPFQQFVKLEVGNKLLLTVAGSVIIVVVLMMTFVETPADKPQPILGELTIKAKQRESPKNNISNYQAIKQRQKKVEKNTLRYKERKSAENPLFSFYKEEKSQTLKKASTPPQKPQQASVNKESVAEEEGFFNIANSDFKKAEQFFEAVFRESQQVQDGRALRIVLKDPIPALNLEGSTILKGIPYLEGGTRLKIKITAAIVDDTVRPVSLRCFDKEDCMEGLYHDDLATQLEESAKNRLLEEALDLEIGDEEKMVRRGKSIVQKFSDLGKHSRKKIIMERGRELFVALPMQEDDL